MNTVNSSYYKSAHKYTVINSFKGIKEGDAVMFNPTASIKRFIYQPLDYQTISKDEKTKNLLVCLEHSRIYINSLHQSQKVLDKNSSLLPTIINTQEKLELYKASLSPELKANMKTIKDFHNYISELISARANHNKILTNYLDTNASSNIPALIQTINNALKSSDDYIVSENDHFKYTWDLTLRGLDIDTLSFYFKDIILIPLPSITSHEPNFSLFKVLDSNSSDICLGFDKKSLDNYYSYCRSLSNYGTNSVRYLNYLKEFQDKLDVFPNMDVLLHKYKTTKSILPYTMIIHGNTSKGVDIFLPIDHCQPVPDNLSFLKNFKDNLVSKYLS